MAQVRAEPAARDSSLSDDETFFNLSPDPICVGTLDGRITRVNPAYVRQVGYTVDDLHGTHFLDLAHPDDRQLAANGLSTMPDAVQSRGQVFRLRCKDGAYRWFDWTARLLADGRRFYAIGRDVTEKRESDQRLAESQQLLQQVLDGSAEGVLATESVRDETGRIVDFRITVANEPAARILRSSMDKVIGGLLSDVLPWTDRKESIDTMREIVERGETVQMAKKFENADPPMWLETTVSKFRDGYLSTFRDVTNRKMAEAELLERTSALQSIVSSALDGIITIDDDANILSINPAAERIFGWSAEELVGQSLTLLSPPAFDGKAPLLVRLVKATTGRIVGRRRELLARRRDGSTFCMELSIGVYESGGKTVRVGVLRDVSQERAAAQKIAEANARFQIVEAASNSGVWDWDLRTNYLYVSPLWKSQLGYAPHEIGDGFAEWSTRLHPDDRERAFRVVDDYINGRTGRYELEHRLRHRDGSYRTMLARGILQKDADGKPAHFIGANTDVTSVKESEDALRASQRTLQDVFDACTEMAIIAVDVEGVVTVFNKGAEQLLGFTAEEMVGKATPAAWHVMEELDEQARIVSAALGRELNGVTMITTIATEQGHCEGEWTQRRKDGKIIKVHLIVTATRDSAGNVNGFMGVSRNITEEKAAIEALRRTNQELLDAQRMLQSQAYELKAKAVQLEAARREADAANLAKSEFLANMSHEIRTPMTAVLGYAQMLLSGDPSPEDRVEWTQGIERNGAHLLALINDVLDLSKIEAGKMQVERLDTSLLGFVAEVDSLMRARAQQKGLTFDVVFKTLLPEHIQTDPVRLRQILVNLLGNAIKFTHTGSVKVLVGLDGRMLRFDVVDTGVGMTSSEVSKLFQPFTQADPSTTRKFGGTGLGLTISRRLAELLGGQIYVWSDTGQGSVFTAVIDPGPFNSNGLLQLNLSSQPEPARLVDRSRPATPKLHGRVLLAEDGPDNRRVIAFHLERAGLQVTFAENGREAVDAAMCAWKEGHPFDLILMDLQMPELDGYGAVAELRNGGYPGPIIALTAHALSGDREKCLDVGCNDYATKPIDKHKLIATVARHLSPRSDHASS